MTSSPDIDREFLSEIGPGSGPRLTPGDRTGDLDLADRHALRRVAGLSTELTDVTEVEYRALRLERVVLVGVWTEGTLENAENSLRELRRLAETAGSVVLAGLVQRRSKPDPATYLGAGKAREVADLVLETGADTVICDGELAPGQLRSMEGVVKVKVIDRTALILDIFAQHARTKAGKTQVELAQLEYLLPRLRGWGESLTRQAGGRVAAGGGIGGRGPGETKIETDRRRIRARAAKLRREIAEIAAGREVQRRRRHRKNVPSVAIAGYTNAGKSTLLNSLTGAGVLVDDSLFATLDPAVRRARTPAGRWFTLTDTVGFVRHLPHQLVEAFGSTLEEVADADLILHVVDSSDADPVAQIRAVREVLADIGAGEVPELVVLNKADAADPLTVKGLRLAERGSVVISASTGAGLDGLLARIEEVLPGRAEEISTLVPYGRSDLVARAHREGEVLAVAHCAEGTQLTARVPPDLAAQLTNAAPSVQFPDAVPGSLPVTQTPETVANAAGQPLA